MAPVTPEKSVIAQTKNVDLKLTLRSGLDIFPFVRVWIDDLQPTELVK